MVRNTKRNSEDFSEENYTHIADKKDLLQKQLDINLAEQLLLKKRIETVQRASEIREKDDPETALFQSQMEMDLIELDELIKRAKVLKEDMETLEKGGSL